MRIQSKLYYPMIFAALAGWISIHLQAASFVRLIQEFGAGMIPELMFFQAITFGIQLFRSSKRGAVKSISLNRFIWIGAATVLVHAIISYFKFPQPIRYSAILICFLAGQVCIAGFRVAIEAMVSQKLVAFENPRYATDLSIAFEVGSLLGASFVGLAQWFIGHHYPMTLVAILYLFPFGLAWYTNYSPVFSKNTKFEIFLSTTGQKYNHEHPPFLYIWIGLLTTVILLKGLSGVGFAIAFQSIGERSKSFAGLFSKFVAMQAVASILILAITRKKSSSLSSWTLGYLGILFFHFFAAFAILVGGGYSTLFFIEGCRKTLENGMLTRSSQLMNLNLPPEMRFNLRNRMEKWATLLAMLIASAVGYYIIDRSRSIFLFLGIFPILLAITGYVLCKILFLNLGKFHLSRLKYATLNDALKIFEFLKHPWTATSNLRLNFLNTIKGFSTNKTRPALLKASLNSMQPIVENAYDARSIEYILLHLNSKREDIQVAAVNALPSKMDCQMKEELLRLLKNEATAGKNIKISLIRVIASKLGSLVVPYVSEILVNNPSPRAQANAIEIIGSFTSANTDETLLLFVLKFLDPKYTRRVRANAVVALYKNPFSRPMALNVIGEFINSEDNDDFAAGSYIVGELGLRKFSKRIYNKSLERNHCAPALLCALAKLNNRIGTRELSKLLVGKNSAAAKEALHYIVYLPFNLRAQIYDSVLSKGFNSVSILLKRMPETARDFDEDRKYIRFEAHLNGYVLDEDSDLKKAA